MIKSLVKLSIATLFVAYAGKVIVKITKNETSRTSEASRSSKYVTTRKEENIFRKDKDMYDSAAAGFMDCI